MSRITLNIKRECERKKKLKNCVEQAENSFFLLSLTLLANEFSHPPDTAAQQHFSGEKIVFIIAPLLLPVMVVRRGGEVRNVTIFAYCSLDRGETTRTKK